MPVLLFKDPFMNAIVKGKKRTTIRTQLRGLKVNQEALFMSGHRKVGVIISNIREKHIDELTQEDAVNDGFKTKEELLNTIRNIYKDKKLDILYIIDFEVVKRYRRRKKKETTGTQQTIYHEQQNN